MEQLRGEAYYEVLNEDSARAKHNIWLKYATACKAEITESELPYSVSQQDIIDEVLGIKEHHEILLSDTELGIVGACRMVYAFAQWVCIWIYVDQKCRRRGILMDIYPQFEHRYGKFIFAPPYSESMVCFLEKITASPHPERSHA